MRWLLLRGLVRETRHWGSFVDTFASGVSASEVVSLDLPGVGTEVGRPVPLTVAGLTDDIRARFGVRAGEGPWAIFAVSLGGMIALDWLSRYPTDFARGVVVNTSAGNLSSPFERLQPRQYGRVLRAMFADPLERERLIVAMVSNSDEAQRERVATEWATFGPLTVNVALRQILAASRSTLPSTLGAPTLVITSKADALVSPRCSERIAAKLGLPICYHPSAGHDIPLDDGPWVAQQVAAWLSHPLRRSGAD